MSDDDAEAAPREDGPLEQRGGWLARTPLVGGPIVALAGAGVTAWVALTWGPRPAVVAASAVALGMIVPAWALLRVSAKSSSWLVTVHRGAVWTAAGAAVVVLAAGLYLVEYPLMQDGRPSRHALALAAAVVGAIVLLATLLGVRWGRSSDPVVDMAIVRISIWVLGGLAATALAGLVVLVTYLFGSDATAFRTGSIPAWRDTANATLGAAPALALLLPHLGSWSSSILYTGLLAFGHHQARVRRVDRLSALRDRLEDHYAHRLVRDDTRSRLRAHIARELDGGHEAETAYLRTRGGIVRVGGLAVLFLLLGGALVFLAVQNEVPPEAQAAPEGGLACPGCTDAEELDTYRSVIDDHRNTLFVLAGAAGVMSLYAGLIVPLILRRMRAARHEIEDHRERMEALERAMLDEVRTASKPARARLVRRP